MRWQREQGTRSDFFGRLCHWCSGISTAVRWDMINERGANTAVARDGAGTVRGHSQGTQWPSEPGPAPWSWWALVLSSQLPGTWMGLRPARLWTRIFVNSYGFNGDSCHRVVSGFVFMNKGSGYLFFLWRSWGKQMWLGLIFIQDIKSVKHLFWGSAWEHPLPAVTFPPVLSAMHHPEQVYRNSALGEWCARCDCHTCLSALKIIQSTRMHFPGILMGWLAYQFAVLF